MYYAIRDKNEALSMQSGVFSAGGGIQDYCPEEEAFRSIVTEKAFRMQRLQASFGRKR